VAKPRRWNTTFIRDYIVLFGVVSSIFDFLAFVLLFLFRATPEEFRTGCSDSRRSMSWSRK
jgi:P-type Mg2+ transporter